ncbi:recombinase family protein [Anaerovorax odorimutans]|uniref:recombinase family protein n=1 Tax=Anaerovorax odorimutans TaxID=109327 RepID=UPI00041C75D7|nr:recombinase family protein [Anaerovorax odorimutans]
MSECIYLRKSRADAEAEARGEGETLARHEAQLMKLAKKLHLNVTKIYKEIVSGESIEARPVMQHLLKEVEMGIWDGVLVVEVERLARGNTLDQGIVSQAFTYSNTLIYTPMKTYDPTNEFDQEYFEFGLFMSRREYKTINRRLMTGKIASINEGKYVGNKPPYGYEIVKIQKEKGNTLRIIPEEAEAVKLIYELYVNYDKGPRLICNELDNRGYKPKYAESWSPYTVQDMLANPVYIGFIRWNGRATIKHVESGKIIKSRPRNENPILVKGLHEPILDKNIWEQAQLIRKSHSRPRLNAKYGEIKNPLAGIIVCGVCGKNMSRRPYNQSGQLPSLVCTNRKCNNISSRLDFVEEELINQLPLWLAHFKLQLEKNCSPATTSNDIEKSLTRANSELQQCINQIDSLHDFLEQGIYTTEIFLERSKKLSEKRKIINNKIDKLKEELSLKEKEGNEKDIIPRIERVIELYDKLDDPADKNTLLKSAIEKVVYTKKEGGKYSGKERSFSLEIFPYLPNK